MTTTQVTLTTNTSQPPISPKATFHMPGIISSTESYIITTQGKSNKESTHSYQNLPFHIGSKIPEQSEDTITVSLIIGFVAIVLILLAASLILIVLLLLCHKKRTHSVKIESNFQKDHSHCTLDRGTKQQAQSQSLNTPSELYDQLQLSPFTGQSEIVHKNESEKVIISLSSDSYQVQVSTVTETSLELLEIEKSNLASPTYAVVDKNNKKGKGSMKESKQEQDNTSQKGIHPKPTDLEDPDTTEKLKEQPSQRQEEMYAVVHKKPKKCEEQEGAPPVPSHTIESLYAAVQKKPM